MTKFKTNHGTTRERMFRHSSFEFRHSALLTAAGFLLTATSCTARVGGDGRDLSQHNDELRRSNQELRKQVADTQQQINLLEGELKTHRQRTSPAGALPEGVVLPTLSGLEFARYTGPVDTDGDGVDDELRLYLRPVDQRGRMLVVAGQLHVQVLRLDPRGQPTVITAKKITPDQWAPLYRSGMTGDHFSVALDLPPAALQAQKVDQITAVVELTEAGTGAVVRQQAEFAIERR